eukprot:scaffold203697_cov17-Tisochrysis_lutea.AAC.1
MPPRLAERALTCQRSGTGEKRDHGAHARLTGTWTCPQRGDSSAAFCVLELRYSYTHARTARTQLHRARLPALGGERSSRLCDAPRLLHRPSSREHLRAASPLLGALAHLPPLALEAPHALLLPLREQGGEGGARGVNGCVRSCMATKAHYSREKECTKEQFTNPPSLS